VLVGRRATGPYAGLWCIPCGYIEWDEDVREAAAREFAEETGLTVTVCEVVAVHSNFHDPNLHTVGIWFRGEQVSGHLHASDGEFSELCFIAPSAPPPLAFATDALVLEQLAHSAYTADS
jgi:ADP-ribose pyrophosphatase YjhB (NUDIX family)